MFKRGAEWRRWDLHVHTKGTNKNDQFNSVDFDSYCKILFKSALNNNIYSIGITDYYSIENYRKVVDYRKQLKADDYFSEEDIIRINQIFLLPNVELRMLPVTKSDRLVNIHCLFNPNYIDSLENDFFTSISFDSHKMNKKGLIDLGKKLHNESDDIKAYKDGINAFIVSTEQLQKLLNTNLEFRKNTIVVVSNSNKDGASGFQQHYDLFEGDNGSLDAVRKFIYRISDCIFSSNERDIKFFSGRNKDGKEATVSREAVIGNCGSLKPCIHGSDAHTESKLFKPDDNRYCWIKADLSFNGLKQILNEPIDRVYIGEEPPLFENIRNNSTKFIDSVNIKPIDSFSDKSTWFNNEILLNKELVAVIGNKGNGKSAIADIIALCCNFQDHNNFSFLKKGKFRDGRLAPNFEAVIKFDSGTWLKKNLNDNAISSASCLVKYLPQGYFEDLCNDFQKVEQFRKEIESVVFQYIDDTQKLGKSSFQELINEKTRVVNESITNLKVFIELINKEIISLEKKENIKYKNDIIAQIKQKEDELCALKEPEKVVNPNDDPKNSEDNKVIILEIESLKKEINDIETKIDSYRNIQKELYYDIEILRNLKQSFDNQVQQIQEIKEKNRAQLLTFKIDIDAVININSDMSLITDLIKEKNNEIKVLGNLIENQNKPEDSLSIKLEKKKELLVLKNNQLGEPQKKYQKYLSDIDAWKKLRFKIEGSETEPNTLSWLKKENIYIEKELKKNIQLKIEERYKIVKQIFEKKQEIISVYSDAKEKIDEKIIENNDLLCGYEIIIESNLSLSSKFKNNFFRYLNQNVKGSFKGINDGYSVLNKIIEKNNVNKIDSLINILDEIMVNMKADINNNGDIRYIDDQVTDMLAFYNYLFSLDFIEYNYQLKQGEKSIDVLSPGEKGALLLVFYLLLDMDNKPLILDQPEDNLDNDSVANILVNFVKRAKKKRQIIMVTHNPNLAVVADAEQIIYVSIDKKNGNKFSFESGSIESVTINKRIVDVLEGAMPAFRQRDKKYYDI